VFDLKLLGNPNVPALRSARTGESFVRLSLVWGAPSVLKHLLGEVAVDALIVPNVRELSGPDESGL